MASRPGEGEPTPQGNRQTPVVDSALFGSAVNCQVPLYLSLRCICQSVTTRETWNWEVHSLGPPSRVWDPIQVTVYYGLKFPQM